MASKRRPKVPPSLARTLYREAGNKCANPGCPIRIVELHHIKEWHVYKTHDEKEMIAVCPTCHTQAHYGILKIDGATIRRWKRIPRSLSRTGHIYVEPGTPRRILLGSIYLETENPDGFVAFEISENHRVSLRMLANDVMIPSIAIADTDGKKLVVMNEGHLALPIDPDVTYECRTGRHRIAVPATPPYLPQWVIDAYNNANPPAPLIDNAGKVTILEAEAIDRGVIQIQGVWAKGNYAVVVTADFLSIHIPQRGFWHIRGYGEIRGEPKHLGKLPVFRFKGPVNESVLSAVLKHNGL